MQPEIHPHRMSRRNESLEHLCTCSNDNRQGKRPHNRPSPLEQCIRKQDIQYQCQEEEREEMQVIVIYNPNRPIHTSQSVSTDHKTKKQHYAISSSKQRQEHSLLHLKLTATPMRLICSFSSSFLYSTAFSFLVRSNPTTRSTPSLSAPMR